jgi:GlcNAc-P-P-Und epimerase
LSSDAETARSRRVLVTGGSGFIGTNVVAAFLRGGHAVLNVDIAPPKDSSHTRCWRHIDIMDRGALQEAFTSFRPELVIHLAARADLDEHKNLAGYATNIQGVSNVIDAIIEVGSVERSFFTSTRLVFDLGYRPTHERDYHASTLYGLSKAHGEELVREAPVALGTWTILRPTGIWGPWFGVPYADFFSTIDRGLYVHPGRQVVYKAYGYVENTVYQIHRLASVATEMVHGQTFWVADYHPVLVREWARLIQEALGARPIRSLPIPTLKAIALVGDAIQRLGIGHAPLTSFRLNNMVSDMLYDTTPLAALVGPLPYSLQQGVDRTVAWIRRHNSPGSAA